MNKLTEFYLNDRTRFALPKSKERLKDMYIRLLEEAEVTRIEDELYYCWIEYGKKSDDGGIVAERLYYLSDGRISKERPGRFHYVLEPLPESPITLDNYKNYLDYLER